MTEDGVDPSERGLPARSPTEVPARRFSDEEVARIIRTASELQVHGAGSAGGGSGDPRGLTLDDLRQVAAEVGIDPDFVEQAVDRVHAPSRREESALAGGAYAWNLHRTVPGEVREEDRDRIVRAIRGVLGQKGEVEDVYGRMEWSYDDGMGPVMVGLSSRDGRTEIDVSARRGSEVGVLLGIGVPSVGFTGGLVVGAGLLGLTGPVLMLPMLGLAGLTWGGGRLLWRHAARGWEDRLTELADAVGAAALEVAVPPELPPAPGEGPSNADEG